MTDKSVHSVMLYKENIYYYGWNVVVAISAVFIGIYIPLNLVIDQGLYLYKYYL